MQKSTLGFLLLFALTSCVITSGPYAEKTGVNASVEGLVKAFDREANGLRGRSANGRELLSKYHSPSGDGYDNATTSSIRGYSKLSILGERRPYTLRMQYIIEKRDADGNYSVEEYNLNKAEKQLRAIMEFLVTRPDRRDFIDDFRPF